MLSIPGRRPLAVLRRLIGDRWANRRRVSALWPTPVDNQAFPEPAADPPPSAPLPNVDEVTRAAALVAQSAAAVELWQRTGSRVAKVAAQHLSADAHAHLRTALTTGDHR